MRSDPLHDEDPRVSQSLIPGRHCRHCQASTRDVQPWFQHQNRDLADDSWDLMRFCLRFNGLYFRKIMDHGEFMEYTWHAIIHQPDKRLVINHHIFQWRRIKRTMAFCCQHNVGVVIDVLRTAAVQHDLWKTGRFLLRQTSTIDLPKHQKLPAFWYQGG